MCCDCDFSVALSSGKSRSCLGKLHGDCSSVCLVIQKVALLEIDIVGCSDVIRSLQKDQKGVNRLTISVIS